MGLDEFLIPREPSPSRPSLPRDGLDDWLVAPPAVPEPTAAHPGEPDAPPPVATPHADAPRPPRWGPEEARPRLVGPEADALPLIAPPTINEPSPSAPAAPAGSPPADAPLATAAPAARGSEAAVAVPPGLDGFLATAPLDEPASFALPRELADDEAVLDPSALVAPRAPDLAADDRGRADPPRAAAVLDAFGGAGPAGFPREASPSEPLGTVPFGPGVEADGAGEAFERIEGRLAQVAERLERAAERLATPPPSIGSRPRAFRGRIDD